MVSVHDGPRLPQLVAGPVSSEPSPCTARAYKEIETEAVVALSAGGPKPIAAGPPPGAVTLDIHYHRGQMDRAMFDSAEGMRLLNDYLGWVNARDPSGGHYYYIGADFVSRTPLDVDFNDVARVSTV